MARWSQGGAGGGTSRLVVPSWALQEITESRDPSLGWGVGNGSSHLCPRQGTRCSGCQGEGLGLQQPAFPPPIWQNPSDSGTRAGAGAPERVVWDQPWLYRGCFQLSHLHSGQGQVLGARFGPLCCQQDQSCSHQRREQTPTRPPCLHCSTGRPWRKELQVLAASAGSLERAGPARCVSTAGVRPCPHLLAHILNPKLGCWSPTSLSCTSLAWGWLLSALALLGQI